MTTQTRLRRERQRQKRHAMEAKTAAMKAAKRAEFERQAAVRNELRAEDMAPRQQRITVEMPVPLRDATTGRLVELVLLRPPSAVEDAQRGGFRRRDPLLQMHRANKRLVTALHLRAVYRLATSYELGVLGASRSVDRYDRVDGFQRPDVPQSRLDAVAAYRAACDAMGSSLRMPVQLVAIHCWELPDVARLLRITEPCLSGYLVAGLDCLADHYWPDRITRMGGEVAEPLVDPTVRDVPQERLGRAGRAAV